MELKDKVAIITGASAGIGRAAALLFAREGARVIVVDLDRSGLETLSRQISDAGGTACSAVADVSKAADVERCVSEALQRFGTIDILFNNAGVVPHGKIDETSEEEWDRVMAVNVKSMYLFCHNVIPVFRNNGRGIILNTASATVMRTVTDRACYNASKGAVLALTRSMALDYVRDNIRVNCICPGTVDTPSLRQRLAAFPDPAEAHKNFIARQPMGRFGTAEEIAEAALYLVSDRAAFVTGQAFSIDGGFSL